MILLRIDDCVFGNLHRIFVSILGIYRNLNLLGKNLELIDGRRTVYVAGHEQRALPFLAFQFSGQLA